MTTLPRNPRTSSRHTRFVFLIPPHIGTNASKIYRFRTGQEPRTRTGVTLTSMPPNLVLVPSTRTITKRTRTRSNLWTPQGLFDLCTAGVASSVDEVEISVVKDAGIKTRTRRTLLASKFWARRRRIKNGKMIYLIITLLLWRVLICLYGISFHLDNNHTLYEYDVCVPSIMVFVPMVC